MARPDQRFLVTGQILGHSLECTGLDGRLRPEVETAAYRIVQEALTNVARHAGVRLATVGCSIAEPPALGP